MHCPICDKTATQAFRPFCSKRCADIDLNGWFSDKYSIPAESPPDGEELEQLIEAMENAVKSDTTR